MSSPEAPGAQGFPSSMLRRPASLYAGSVRLLADADGSSRGLESSTERRLLFGREQLHFFKIQAGVAVGAGRVDWRVRLSPRMAVYSGRIFEGVDATQVLEPADSPALGHFRRVRLTNSGGSPVRIRTIEVSDPTSAHFRDPANRWGSLGVNAFNRDTHVAMDEVGGVHPARVAGSLPGPRRIFMTTDRQRAAEALQAGDVAESTAGMSGQVLILSSHEFDIPPAGSVDVVYAQLYSPSKLEDVLAEFGRVKPGDRATPPAGASFACSSARVSEAFAWARAALDGAQGEGLLLDRLDSLAGLRYVNPRAAGEELQTLKARALKGGLLPHSDSPAAPGVLESALYLSAASRFISASADKRAARGAYASLKKTAVSLAGLGKGGPLYLDESVPQGWRRLIGSGYPAGEVPEVTLAASAALADFSGVSRMLGKGEEAARFRERGDLLADGIRKRAVDPSGCLGASVDRSGKVRVEATVDMAVACYRSPVLREPASTAVHRLLEKDFDTDYGPRTVSAGNSLYFSGSYGQGQLGGYWTRAALAFACLSYAVGLPGTGSLALEKVSRLVVEDALKLGGVPGEYPRWVDLEAKEVRGEGPDRVAASRFIQGVVEGDMGLTTTAEGASFRPPSISTLKWVMAGDIWAGEKVSAFVGRAGQKSYAFAAGARVQADPGRRFSRAEPAEASARGVSAISFSSPGQVVCVGSSLGVPAKLRVTVAARSPGFTKRLSTAVEELDPGTGAWSKTGTLRVAPSMTLDVALRPGEWKAYRISND